MTEVDWVTFFNPEVVFVQANERGSRAYILWDPDEKTPLSPKFPEVVARAQYSFRIYLDKLPTTSEGAKLYFLQSFTEVSQSLYNDGQALAGEYMKYDFNFNEGHPKVLAKIDALKQLTDALSHPLGYPLPSRKTELIAGDVTVLHDTWLLEFYRLMFSWYAALLKDITGLPEGLKFWE